MENRLLKPRRVLLAMALIVIAPMVVMAYSPYYTHPDLTEQIARLNNRALGTDNLTASDSNIEHLRQGAIDEDDPPRWINHFYDPVHHTGWRGTNLGGADPGLVYTVADSMAPIDALPSIVWATNQKAQSLYRQQGNQTWQKAVQSFLHGDEKSAYLALGHILHLIEDASVPEHTRGDTHVHLLGDLGSPYEDYSQKFTNLHALNYSGTLNPSDIPSFVSLDQAFNFVASYSNKNFYSPDTFYGDFSSPSTSTLKIVSVSSDGKMKRYIFDQNNGIYLAVLDADGTPSLNDDAVVLPSYKDHLFPVAILTGASVMKMFFKEVKLNLDGKITSEPLYEAGFFELLAGQLNIPWWGTALTGVTDIEALYSKYQAGKQLSYLSQTPGADKAVTDIVSPPYTPTLFHPATGTISIAASTASLPPIGLAKITTPLKSAGALDSSGQTIFSDGTTSGFWEALAAESPETSTLALAGSTEYFVPGTAGYTSTLYSQAATTLSSDLGANDRGAIVSAIAGIGIDTSPQNAAATAMLLATALAALGYTVRPRIADGEAVFDIVKQVPRTVTDSIVNTTNILVPVVRQVVGYVNVPVTEVFTKPVQIIKNVVNTAYQWVQEAVPIVRQVAHTVYDYVSELIPQTVKTWLGDVWDTVTKWVSAVVPVVKTVYETVVDTVYQWVKKPIEYVTQVAETVYQAATKIVYKTVPVLKDVVDYETKTVATTSNQSRTVYDDVVVGTIAKNILPSTASELAPVDIPVTPPPAPRYPPNIFFDSYAKRYWMLSAGLSSFPNGGGGVARFFSDQSRAAQLFGNNVATRIIGTGSAGWTAENGGGTTGGDMPLDTMWRQMQEVFEDGTAPVVIEDYIAGKPGTGHPMGWAWKPVEMIDPSTNIIYTVDATQDGNFQDQLGWRRTDTGLYTTEQLMNAIRSGEGYDSIAAFKNHTPYTTNPALLATPATGKGAPTAFQLYFAQQRAAGRASEDILAHNPYMYGGALYQAPVGVTLNNYTVFDVPFIEGLSAAQRDSIQHMLTTRSNQGWGLNATDAQNFAYAVGASNWTQFQGKSPNEALTLARPRTVWGVGSALQPLDTSKKNEASATSGIVRELDGASTQYIRENLSETTPAIVTGYEANYKTMETGAVEIAKSVKELLTTAVFATLAGKQIASGRVDVGILSSIASLGTLDDAFKDGSNGLTNLLNGYGLGSDAKEYSNSGIYREFLTTNVGNTTVLDLIQGSVGIANFALNEAPDLSNKIVSATDLYKKAETLGVGMPALAYIASKSANLLYNTLDNIATVSQKNDLLGVFESELIGK